MKRATTVLIATLALVALLAAPANAAKGGKKLLQNYSGVVGTDPNAPSSITLDQAAPIVFGETVNFTVNVNPNDLFGLKTSFNGSIIDSWPMVVVECFDAPGKTLNDTADVLYAQLDHPDAEFTIGSGSPWSTHPETAGYCDARLLVYEQIIDIAPPLFFTVA